MSDENTEKRLPAPIPYKPAPVTPQVSAPAPAVAKIVHVPPPAERIPENIHAEMAVLGSMLLDRDVIPQLATTLDASDFHHAGHAIVFRRIVELAVAGKTVDLTSLADVLRTAGEMEASGGYVYLANLEQAVLSTSAAMEHATIVRAHSTTRRIIRACEQTIRDAKSSFDPSELARLACERLFHASGMETHSGFATVSDVAQSAVSKAFEARDNRMNNRKNYPVFGIHDLDSMIELVPGHLDILAANSSIGKTALALQLYKSAVKAGHPCCYFSLEMDNDPIMTRMICAEAGLDSSRISKGYASDAELQLFAQHAAVFDVQNGVMNDCLSLTSTDFLMKARMLKMQFGGHLPLCIIDGLWLMRHPDTSDTMADRIGDTTRALKSAAKELQTCIVLLHQLNRDNQKKASGRERASGSGSRPQLSDLRGSGAVEQDADATIFLHRERVETTAQASAPVRVPTEIILAKNRHGPIGTTRVLYETTTQRFLDAAR